MNKLDLHPSLKRDTDDSATIPTVLSAAIDTDLKPARRMIILVPTDWDYHVMTRRLWEFAETLGAHIQFLGLCKDAAQEPSLRRELVMMASLVQNDKVSAEARIEFGTSWVEAVKRDYQTGDMIVCFAEQRTGLWQRPLSQILQSNLNATVYILSGLSPQTRPNWLSQITVWIGSLAIIVMSFLLQIRITSLSQDWAQTSLLILSVIGEVWLIWAWNNLFR